MSYDYNSQDNRFDFPNPYRIENAFYFIAAAVLLLGGLSLLLTARKALGQSSHVAWLPLGIGLVMLVHGLKVGAEALSRLRFFFGRGQPQNLSQNLSADQTGSTSGAEKLKNLLRHNSLEFKEPTGPLNGALYSMLPNLIFAPSRIQQMAQRQFQNALIILVTLLSLLVSMLGASAESASWLGLFYFGLTLFILLKPLDAGDKSQIEVGLKGLIILILIAVLGPVIVPRLVHDVAPPVWLPGTLQAAVVMIVTEAAIMLFFMAVINQTLKTPPQASMAVEQGTLTMNSHPKQILDELERELQNQWIASLPNRRYARRVPEVQLNIQSGSFEGELLEETQPVPNGELPNMTLKSCFSEPRYRWLGWLNSYGLVMMALSVLSLIFFAKHFFTQEQGIHTVAIPIATLGISLWILGNYCFKAGKVLWGRFDFISRLVWVEMKGNYQSAQMDYGNQFTDRIKTQKQVINIESMTLRVWIAEIETVTFGKDSDRFILAMRGLKNEAATLHAHLSNFAQQQSMIVAPTSSVDMHRANALGVMNQLGEHNREAQQALPGAISQAIQSAAAPASQAPTPQQAPAQTLDTCPACHPARLMGSKFCPECGSKL